MNTAGPTQRPLGPQPDGRVLGEQTLGLPRLKSTSEQPAQEVQSHLGPWG